MVYLKNRIRKTAKLIADGFASISIIYALLT